MYYIFAFLIFNIRVRSKNCRMNIFNITKKNFSDIEYIIQSLNSEKLKTVKIELETFGKTADEGVNQLLRSLLLYRFRQLISKKSRLNLRRKILSFIIYYDIPAIQFIFNPNNLINPVKLKLAVYWSCLLEKVEIFLTSLDIVYKRIQLTISDSVSSVIFFYKEISIFFEHYIKIGKDSVFGQINQYFGIVETNKCGSFYLYGLL